MELLVVILIIMLVSAVALPTVLPALAHREVGEAGRLLQGAIVGARDRAIHADRPAGFRLVPDPAIVSYQPARLPDGSPNPQAGWVDRTRPLAYNHVLPIAAAPEYRDGLVSVFPGRDYSALTPLPGIVLEAAPLDADGLPAAPTSWAWNIRVGDRIQVGGAGPWYTVAGPMFVMAVAGNPEGFINYDPNRPPPVEYLILANGRDDGPMAGVPGVVAGPDGWIDSGWDGVDNDGNGVVDELAEWEREEWLGPRTGFVAASYEIRRRPMPVAGSTLLALPTHVVIDAARSRMPVNPLNGSVDLMIGADGTAAPVLPYGVPSSLGLDAAWSHFALVDRADVIDPAAGTPAGPKADWSILSLSRAGRTVITDSPDPADPFRWAMSGGR